MDRLKMTDKIQQFLSSRHIRTPALIVDLDQIEENYKRLRRALPSAEIYYALKANPAMPLIKRLVGLGSQFDGASLREIDICLAAGADPSDVSFGNTIKKADHIAAAHRQGITLFAFDAEEELRKIAAAAPGARVYCRLQIDNDSALWPLSRKFGCSTRMACDLMVLARDLGLVPHGLSFHVGSQQTDPGVWEAAIGRAAMVFTDLARRDIPLKMLNLGGGFPTKYRADIPAVEIFAGAIRGAVQTHFGNAIPDLIVEPGRAIAASAGLLLSEVVLVARKDHDAETRWVYLDVGKFGGLAETMDEAIRYDIRTDRDTDPKGPVCLAGPTCDGADILYEKSGYNLPLSLRAGDRLRLLAAGAYTSSYASAGFNGFAPPDEYYI